MTVQHSMRLFVAGLALAIGSGMPLLAQAAAPPAAKVTVTEGYVPEAPPGVRVFAGFMTVRNPGRQTVVLTGASSPDFKRVEMHASKLEGGMATMVEVHNLPVPAGGKVAFAPGGHHFMMFEPNHPVVKGSQISLVLTFADGKTQTVKLEVRDGRQIYRH